MPRDVEEDASKDGPSWCVVVNSSPNSLVRSRQRLHNMLMQLEREGAAIVDRPMSCADLALSMTTCCCIWTEQSLKVSLSFTLMQGNPWTNYVWEYRQI